MSGPTAGASCTARALREIESTYVEEKEREEEIRRICEIHKVPQAREIRERRESPEGVGRERPEVVGKDGKSGKDRENGEVREIKIREPVPPGCEKNRESRGKVFRESDVAKAFRSSGQALVSPFGRE